MKVAFRADASVQIGTGHVMRCLTLAEELRRHGHQCLFVCRSHEGHLADLITQKGFELHLLLPSEQVATFGTEKAATAHSDWLGVPWQTDAKQTLDALRDNIIDWLIVDHYSLDSKWESQLAAAVGRIMVIDDLADRPHHCELLLDQTFGRQLDDYREWLPPGSELLCGSQYALLRPEFAELRSYSLKRRDKPQLRQLLITMGGIDKDNATGKMLETLHGSALPSDCEITVVMGSTAPWLTTVKQQAETMPWPTKVKVGVTDMARLMAESDLAIGAAGATSWERCCLGLPTIMIVLADNQWTIAKNLNYANAAKCIENPYNEVALDEALINITLEEIAKSAAAVCDGMGTQKVIRRMCEYR